jgi:hypothetical protein
MFSAIASAVFGFLWHLVSGDAYRLWADHKQSEADDAKNKTNALSDSAAVIELRDKWTTKP